MTQLSRNDLCFIRNMLRKESAECKAEARTAEYEIDRQIAIMREELTERILDKITDVIITEAKRIEVTK